jgi:hypothetical protein
MADREESSDHPSGIADHLRSLLEADGGALKTSFERDGFVVIRDGLPSAAADGFYKDVARCHREGHTSPNKVQFLTSSGSIEVTKPGIFECDVHTPERRRAYPWFSTLFEGGEIRRLGGMFNDVLKGADLALTAADPAAVVSSTVTVKMQVNEGGAFPWHYDNPARPNKRKLTMAVYLTPQWHEGDGGELQLWPFLADAPISVPPLLNTVVLFRSDLILHRVCKKLGDASSQRRYCFTIWFDSTSVNSDEDVHLRAKHLTAGFIPTLKSSPVQRSLSRIVYDAEYRTSLADCFESSSRDWALSVKLHEAHCAPLLSNEAVMSFVRTLRRPASNSS